MARRREEPVRKKQKTSWRKKGREKRLPASIDEIREEINAIREKMRESREVQQQVLEDLMRKSDLKQTQGLLKKMNRLDISIAGVEKQTAQGIGTLILSREMLKKNVDLIMDAITKRSTPATRAQLEVELHKTLGELKAVNSLLREYNKKRELLVEKPAGETVGIVDAVYEQMKKKRLV